jgi:hypothetical protein
VRAFEDDVVVRRPRRTEDWYLLRARARISIDEVAEVWTAEWLPRAGVLRTTGGGADWIAAPPRLRAALDRAARGLRAQPAATLSGLGPPEARARVVEVFSPTDEAPDRSGGSSAIALVLGGLAPAAGLGGIALRARRRPGRRSAAAAPIAH